MSTLIRTSNKAGRRLGLVIALGASLVGCSSSAASSSPAASSPAASASASAAGGTTVTADLSEFKIVLGSATGPAGAVTFSVTNKGSTVHEFVVFKTDLAPDKLPLSADGTEVDEAGAGLTAVDEVEDVAVGTTATLPVDLPAGHYVLICNLPAHYTSGMHAEFTAGS
jgi:uncharacterized cupredoxin-like copper-binding protein